MSGTNPPAVYNAIAAVMAHMAKEGISKDRRSGDGGGPKFIFRGIDDIYNALAPVLAANKLMMLPRVLSRDQVERTTKNGGVMFYTTVEAEFDLVSAEDGSRHTIKTFGEAMDSSDKSTNKAMSAAFKYAAMQAFCIPTEGDNDADAATPEVAPQCNDADPAAAMIQWVNDAKAGLKALVEGEEEKLTKWKTAKAGTIEKVMAANPALYAELSHAIGLAEAATMGTPF